MSEIGKEHITKMIEEREKKIKEILKLFPYKPMFGTRTGQKNKNHWIVFIKHRFEKELEIF